MGLRLALRKKYPYLELFWSANSRIRTKYGETRSSCKHYLSSFDEPSFPLQCLVAFNKIQKFTNLIKRPSNFHQAFILIC